MNPLEVLIAVTVAGAATAAATPAINAVMDQARTTEFGGITDCTTDVLADNGTGALEAITGIRDGSITPELLAALEECAYPVTGNPNDPLADIPEDIRNELEGNQ